MNQYCRVECLNTIPQKKVTEALEDTIRSCPECSVKKNVKFDSNLCIKCRAKNLAIVRYAESNIPVAYWNLEMDSAFVGDKVLFEKYKDVTLDLYKSYRNGVALCFAGSHGVGKSSCVTNILKRACEKGFSCMYVNLGDIVAAMLNSQSEDKALARKELLTVDFLVIDEFDPRYMSNDKSSDLFGKILEEVFRTRSQNKLPIFLCTNSPNVVESFTGSIKQSITSLLSTVKMIPVLGRDFRVLNKVK